MSSSAEALRLAGADRYSAKDFTGALHYFDQSLAAATEADDVWRILGNRSQAHFALERFAQAHSDASRAIALLSKLPSSNKKTREAMSKLRLRQSDAEKRLFELASKQKHSSTDFLSSALEVFHNPDVGRGLCTTRDVLPGELLVIASPICLLQPNTAGARGRVDALGEMAQALMQSRDEEVLNCLNDLDDGTNGEEDKGLDVKEVLKRNAFELVSNQVFALYHMPSLVNHACAANLCIIFFGNTLVLRSARALQRGEQVTIRYFDCCDMLLQARRDKTRLDWNLTCQCAWCLQEEALIAQGGSVLEKMQALKLRESALCQRFFASKGAGLLDLHQDLHALCEEVEADVVRGQKLLRACFASTYQVHRACSEAVAGTDAVRAQDWLLEMQREAEPSSFAHCKTSTLAELFASSLGKERLRAMQEERLRVHQIRYGRESLLLAHALEQSKAAVLTKNPLEWTLDLKA